MVTCPLTGQTVQFAMDDPSKMIYHYETPKTGKVVCTDVALTAIEALSDEEKNLLTGICRNRTINNEKPIIISANTLTNLAALNPVMGFEPRARHLISIIYGRGGNEYQDFQFVSTRDSALTYSSMEEFERIMRFLKTKGWIDIRTTTPTTNGCFYQGDTMSEASIAEIEKGLPKMPMYGLVSQEITSGDADMDKQIEQARKLFLICLPLKKINGLPAKL